jgi:hypothetical protein
MTLGMKMMVFIIFISVMGLFLGFAGLMFDWQIAKTLGIVSGVILAIVFWLSSGVKNETLDRFLRGRKED